MDVNNISIQLKELSQSLLDVILILKQSNSSTLNHAMRIDLLNSLSELIQTLIILNQLYISNSDQSQIYKPGQIVLIPRYFNGSMCQDFAVIVPEEESITQSNSFSTSPTEENIDDMIKLVWIRPQSNYELYNEGINYTKSQIHNITDESIIQRLHNQENFLPHLQTGESIIFLFDQQVYDLSNLSSLYNSLSSLSDLPFGLWLKGTVVSIINEGASIQISTTSLSKYYNLELNKKIILIVPLKISNIAPIPISETITNKISNHPSSHHPSPIFDDKVVGKSDDDDDNKEDSEYEGVTDVQSYYKSSSSRPTTTGSTTTTVTTALGAWESNTKGIGSKIMAKMGYNRMKGLGKHTQGIIEPIDALLKPLPAGLSLDYIKEHKDNQKEGLKGKTDELKRKSKKKENFIQEESNMFDFLNRMEEKIYDPPPYPTQSSISNGNSSIKNGIKNVKNIF